MLFIHAGQCVFILMKPHKWRASEACLSVVCFAFFPSVFFESLFSFSPTFCKEFPSSGEHMSESNCKVADGRTRRSELPPSSPNNLPYLLSSNFSVLWSSKVPSCTDVHKKKTHTFLKAHTDYGLLWWKLLGSFDFIKLQHLWAALPKVEEAQAVFTIFLLFLCSNTVEAFLINDKHVTLNQRNAAYDCF